MRAALLDICMSQYLHLAMTFEPTLISVKCSQMGFFGLPPEGIVKTESNYFHEQFTISYNGSM